MSIPPTPKANRVILIHGLHQTAWVMRPMAKRLQAQGFRTHQYAYRSMRDDIQTNSRRLNDWLTQYHDPEQPFDLVGHSLGGLIIRDFVYRYPKWMIGRCVTLGTPHTGSTCAEYIKRLSPVMMGRAYKGALDGGVPALPAHIMLGVIAGDKPYGVGQLFLEYHNRKLRRHGQPLPLGERAHDGTVYVSETKIEGACDHLVLPVTHTGMLVNPEVARQTLHFLQHGEFNHAKRAQPL